MSSMEHIRYLAETIGPRGSTRPGEAQAAQYAERVLRESGLSPISESFRSARSAYHPYLIFSGMMLTSEILFLSSQPWGIGLALGFGLLGLGSICLELAFHPNPIRWIIPKGSSQNVWARIKPQGQVRKSVVLLGHLDSHRTPLVFSSARWLKLFGTLVPLGLISTLLLILLFTLTLFWPGPIWRILSLPMTLILLGVFGLTLQADFTPYSPGANDNASGVGVVLSTAQRLHKEPLGNTEVWAVLTGCEEVACYGADAFASTHRQELIGALWLTVDSVGTTEAGPTYTTQETFLLTSNSDPGLIALAERISSQHPELGAYPHVLKGAFSEGVIGAKYGLRLLSFGSAQRDGSQPEWHKGTDVVEEVDPEVVGRCEFFIWQFLNAIDGQ